MHETCARLLHVLARSWLRASRWLSAGRGRGSWLTAGGGRWLRRRLRRGKAYSTYTSPRTSPATAHQQLPAKCLQQLHALGQRLRPKLQHAWVFAALLLSMGSCGVSAGSLRGSENRRECQKAPFLASHGAMHAGKLCCMQRLGRPTGRQVVVEAVRAGGINDETLLAERVATLRHQATPVAHPAGSSCPKAHARVHTHAHAHAQTHTHTHTRSMPCLVKQVSAYKALPGVNTHAAVLRLGAPTPSTSRHCTCRCGPDSSCCPLTGGRAKA